MSKTVMLRVRDRKTGVERTVTHKAYAAMGPRVYEKLGTAEDESAPAPAQKIAPVQNIHRAVSAPVVRKQIPAIEEQDPEPESDTAEAVEAKPEKRKPGRPAKSISSNPTDDEK